MFSTSSQLKHWTFSSPEELAKLRAEATETFVLKHGAQHEESYRATFFLSSAEERLVVRHYEYVLKEFCKHFQPPMPTYVMHTAMAFLKRFYLHNSVMDYHPKDITYTCVYLACKVEEFNVSILQFVSNQHGDRERAADVLLQQELLLMQQLHYHLTVYNCCRPLEGLLIDIKTRCPYLEQPERLRRGAEEFIERSLHTDVSLLFPPSQIAVAAVLSSGAKINVNLDNYVTDNLLVSGTEEELAKAVDRIKRIRYMTKHLEPLEREEVRAAETKLSQCRNPENDPDSDIYRENRQALSDEEDERRTAKNMRIAEEERRTNLDLIS